MTPLITDIHTHRVDATRALIAVSPRDFNPQPGLYYSVGYHPWFDVDTLNDDDFALLEQCARHPQVLAIGETGMDNLRGAPLDVQRRVFIRHLQLAGALGMPVITHCVRTATHILNARHTAGLDRVTLVIHGMRGNENVASTLLDAGCYLSFGARFNPRALAVTPLDRLLIETDDAPLDINQVADAVATAINLSSSDLMTLTAATAASLLQRQ